MTAARSALEERLTRELSEAASLAPPYDHTRPVTSPRRSRMPVLLGAAAVLAVGLGGAAVAGWRHTDGPADSGSHGVLALPRVVGPRADGGPDPSDQPCDVVTWRVPSGRSAELQNADCTRTSVLAPEDGTIRQTTLSPDEKTLAVLITSPDKDDEIVHVGPGSGMVGTVLTGGRIDDFAWSPDGRQIAAHLDGRIDVTRLDPPSEHTVVAVAGTVTGLSWSPDGRSLAWEDDGLHVCDVGAGTVTRVPGRWPSPGTELVGYGTDGQLWLVGTHFNAVLFEVDPSSGSRTDPPTAGTNARGQTYGPGTSHADLVSAYGQDQADHGVFGYVSNASTSRETRGGLASAEQENQVKGYVVPLYLTDGRTLVGAFQVASPPSGLHGN